ncbi:MAG: hypothetical protein HC830_13825, partial [Bacteroidetes bacterium]|nr:hypothetical protein [Bacteroidota bacterium]
MKKLLLFFVATTLGISIMAQDADLKLKLEKNKVYRFKSVSTQNISQTINGMEQTTTSGNDAVMSLKMIDATAGLIVAEVRFDTIITNTNTMGKQVKITSASEGNIASEDAGEVMSAIMNRLSKNAIYVKLNATGEVTEIVNLALLRDIILKDTGAISPKLAPMLKPQIKNTVTLEALKTMINAFTFNLPAKQVKKGEQWNINVPVSSGGMSLEIATNYILESIKDNVAVVKAESGIKAAANAAPLEYPGAKITYDGIQGIGKSNMSFNTSTGLIIENVTKTNITGDLNVNASGMSMQIPMKITGETFVKS